MNQRLFYFVGGEVGPWRVTSMSTLVGEPLAQAKRIEVHAQTTALQKEVSWLLRGITSNDRYVVHPEKEQLVKEQPSLGRPEARCAALIPIRKNPAWWALPQDARRELLEKKSRHIAIGLSYLPAVARRLHHCRDLGENEPFDFLTWFEYAPADEAAFNHLASELRGSEEWQYVDREIDIRLVRESEYSASGAVPTRIFAS